MNIAVTGATGFLGRRVIAELAKAGHSPNPLARNQSPESLNSADAIIHLAGEPVAQRWTPEAKQRIYASRVEGTRNLVDAISKNQRRPEVLVCASAIGIYGSRGDEILKEDSPPAADFLARVVVDWENAAQSAEALGIRVVNLRFGVVLGNGGALAKMLPPFKLGIGGQLGSGNQWTSWIHIDDAVNLILFALENGQVRRAVNATAPHPVTNAQFTRELARVLHRPAIFPVPPFALRLMFGEMADVVLASQRVLPAAAQAAGFEFRYGDLPSALANLLAQ
jgi:uncharacterized protein (TIGR01777 family)